MVVSEVVSPVAELAILFLFVTRSGVLFVRGIIPNKQYQVIVDPFVLGLLNQLEENWFQFLEDLLLDVYNSLGQIESFKPGQRIVIVQP